MAVLINFKICDNAKECNGIEVCPTGALSWDEKNKTIKIDNSKCNNCGLCENACEVDAIRIARTDEEYEEIKKVIDEDPRKISDLLVDRYGAQPIEPAFLISQDKFNLEVLEASRPVIVEFFNDDSIKCLRWSIPIKKLISSENIKFRKLQLSDDSLLKKYNIKESPALLFFKDGQLIGKIEGYYNTEQFDEISKKIKEIEF